MKYRIIASAICISVTLGGCGSFAGRHGIDSGYAYIDSHEYAKALASFESAEENGEDACLIHRGKGIAYLYCDENEQAAQELLASLAEDDGIVDDMDFDTNYYLAEAYMRLDDFNRAKGIYDAILSLRDKDPTAYYLRGVCELKAGGDEDKKSADADFTNAIRLNSKDYSMIVMIYKAYAENGDEEKAKTILQHALESDEKTMSNFEKGEMYFYLGNDAEAQNYLSKANKESGGHDTKESVVLLLGQSYERQQQYDYAISVYKEYLKNNSKSANISNQLGMCQVSKGRFYLDSGNEDEAANAFGEAIISFDGGIQLNDNAVQQALMFNKICAYEYSGDFESAYKLMKDYMTMYPLDKAAKDEMTFLETR